MAQLKKDKITMPLTELRGNDKIVTQRYILEMKLLNNINSGKPPSTALDEK